jgi:PleD family two-component response regulator
LARRWWSTSENEIPWPDDTTEPSSARWSEDAADERARILIADDEPFNLEHLEQILKDDGYDTISAENGWGALALVAAEPPDLILRLPAQAL